MTRFFCLVAVFVSAAGCGAVQRAPDPLVTVLHSVATGDPNWPYALVREDVLCRSKTRPPNADCPLSRWNYTPLTAPTIEVHP